MAVDEVLPGAGLRGDVRGDFGVGVDGVLDDGPDLDVVVGVLGGDVGAGW